MCVYFVFFFIIDCADYTQAFLLFLAFLCVYFISLSFVCFHYGVGLFFCFAVVYCIARVSVLYVSQVRSIVFIAANISMYLHRE